VIKCPDGFAAQAFKAESATLVSKYHGAGNDFIFAEVSFEALQAQNSLDELRNWVKNICHRHTGLGADGVVLVEKKLDGNVEALILNADGTLAATCGNALRCLSHFCTDRWQNDKSINVVRPKFLNIWLDHLGSEEAFASAVEAYAECSPWVCEGESKSLGHCKVQMGSQSKVHLLDSEVRKIALRALHVESSKVDFKAFFVQLQNPHIVLFHDDFTNLTLSNFDSLGRSLQKRFAESGYPVSNIGFAWKNQKTFGLVVFERGAGLTQACGSGATAAFGALEFQNENLGFQSKEAIDFEMPGGVLSVSGSKSARVLTGPSQKIADFWFTND
jgi:diaminopimelate epimerase